MDWNAVAGISTGVLTLITAYYAYVTHRLLHENAGANAFQREAFELQMGAALCPHLFCSIEKMKSGLSLIVVNASNRPAFDVDLLLLSVFDNDELPLSTFMDKFVKTKNKTVAGIEERLADGTFYSVFNHMVYASFPTQRQVTIRFSPPATSDQYLLLFQFRDSRGTNYGQTYWFISSHSNRYALGSLQPEILRPVPRLDYEVTDDGPKLKVGDRERIPSELLRDFEPMFAAGLSSGWAPAFNLGIEDPGEWTTV